MTESTGREINWPQLKAQLGQDLYAVSGGRALRLGASTIDLPVASGYRVRITLEANDTYTVERIMVRGAKTFHKGRMTDVYADAVGDAAYYASCFRDGPWGEA